MSAPGLHMGLRKGLRLRMLAGDGDRRPTASPQQLCGLRARRDQAVWRYDSFPRYRVAIAVIRSGTRSRRFRESDRIADGEAPKVECSGQSYGIFLREDTGGSAECHAPPTAAGSGHERLPIQPPV